MGNSGSTSNTNSVSNNVSNSVPTNIPVASQVNNPVSGSVTNPVNSIKFTTYLKKLMGSDTLNNTNVETIAKYEKFLTDCCYMARLIYAPSEVIFKCMGFMDITPDRFNDVITLTENTLYKNFPYHELYDTDFIKKAYNQNFTKIYGANRKTTGGVPIGYFFKNDKQLNGMIMYDKKTNRLYIVFKGSSSIKDFIHDLKTQPYDYSKLPYLSSIKSEEGYAMGHSGFAQVIKYDVMRIISMLLWFNTKYSPSEIIITGHSLGGALSTVLGLCLGYGIRNNEIPKPSAPIHVVTFGAPMMFSDYLRNKFNELLDLDIITFDRVTNSMDVVVGIPPVFSHGGYNILKTEIYPFKNTKRTTQIRELRSLFNLPLNKDNTLPSYSEFLNLFKNPSSTIDQNSYKENLKHIGGTTSQRRKEIIHTVFPTLSPEYIEQISDIPPITNEELTQVNEITEEAKEASADNTPQAGGEFSLMKHSSYYKSTTKSRFPNKVFYDFYKILSANFSHAEYMGLGYLAGLRLPSKSGRKREPVSEYIFMSTDDGQLYSVACNNFFECVQAGGSYKAKTKQHKHN